MRKKNEFVIYTCMWTIAVVILIVVLIRNVGDARIVNYSGIVRGATQKLIKEEMSGHPDDELIRQLDGIIENLQTGEGDFNLRRNKDEAYQEQLAKLEGIWCRLKDEVRSVRNGGTSRDNLYELSQEHFDEADKMVLLAEQSSDRKLLHSIAVYVVALLLSVCVFAIVNRRSSRALEKSIYTDSLTGILNREGFKAAALALLGQHSGRAYCLIEFDIDDFKFFNSSYGFEQGDRLLKLLAYSLQERYHKDQICARATADDFVILADNGPKVTENLRNFLSAILKSEEQIGFSENITFTIGACEILEGGDSIQSLMDKANMAHKSAKTQGKSMTVWYDETLLEKMSRENRLANRLHRSLGHGEFRMYLQPKYDLKDLKIESAEALVRWDIPDEGLIYPDQFIPLFERNGSVAEIDFYILEQACRYIRSYIDAYGKMFSISVNFSRVTLYQQKCYSKILDIVDEYRIPRRCIEIEITESALSGLPDAIIEKLQGLQKAGFSIAMDDFGSGYSSLNQLGRLPIQVIKLDREFLWQSGKEERAKHIIACVTELAHKLGVKVVCEGIEKKEHVDFLRSIGCDCGQGYYFSRPVPWEETFNQESYG